MRSVFTPQKVFVGLLIASLAGCSTTTPRGARHAGNWSPAEPDGTVSPEMELVPDEPHLAPATGAVPALGASQAHMWIPLIRWVRENNAGSVQRISAGPTPTFAWKTANGILILHADSQIATWNGLELHLGFMPQLVNNEPFVHVLDLTKNLEPLMRHLTLPARPNRVIVIDPGHGGANTGTHSILDGRFEKEFTLDWAERLEPLLAAGGWRVFLTRTDDTDVSLSNRVAFAEAHKADLFLSLHFNAPPSPTNHVQAGVETYCLTPMGMPSTLTRGYEDNIALLFPNNHFDSENLQYGVALQRALLKVAGASDRGVRHARFMGVLRGQNRPAVLIEGGYLSNPREARHIEDPVYRQKLAEAVASVLVEKNEKNEDGE